MSAKWFGVDGALTSLAVMFLHVGVGLVLGGGGGGGGRGGGGGGGGCRGGGGGMCIVVDVVVIVACSRLLISPGSVFIVTDVVHQGSGLHRLVESLSKLVHATQVPRLYT